jgi:hypothetical protein
VRRILHKDINFHPYKVVLVQELSDCDMANRSTLAEHLIRILSNNVIFLMTDEAHFHISGCVNKQNFHYWAEENPQQLHQRLLHSARVTVCCGMANFGVTGPISLKAKVGMQLQSHLLVMLKYYGTSSHQN